MNQQLKKGDVIVVSQYITPDNVKISQHSFVVLETQRGKIAGVEIGLDLELEFDLVASVMSSIKNNKHRKVVEDHYPKSMIVEFNDAQISNGNAKDGFIKANQLHYFRKKDITYTKIGCLNEKTLDKLLELIELNDQNGDLIPNYNNLVNQGEIEEIK